MPVTVTDLTDQRQQFIKAVNKINDQNNLHEIEQTLNGLEQILSECERRGGFQNDGPARVGRYSTTQAQIDEEMKENTQGILADARLQIARNSLRLLQKAIPRLEEICKRGMEIAGKDAVRAVCAPEMRSRTDLEGRPFSPVPSGFTLPAAFESSSVISKIKSAIVK